MVRKKVLVSVTQINSAAPQTTSTKMSVVLNQHQFKTVSAKPELSNLTEHRFEYRIHYRSVGFY